MPSLPVRGFGEDGLLVTGGVGAAGSAAITIAVSGTLAAVVGAAVMDSAALALSRPATGAGYRPLPRTMAVCGELRAVTGSVTMDVDSTAALEAMWMLDDDLVALAA